MMFFVSFLLMFWGPFANFLWTYYYLKSEIRNFPCISPIILYRGNIGFFTGSLKKYFITHKKSVKLDFIGFYRLVVKIFLLTNPVRA